MSGYVNYHYYYKCKNKNFSFTQLYSHKAAGNVTVGLALHWPRITDISGSPRTGSRPK